MRVDGPVKIDLQKRLNLKFHILLKLAGLPVWADSRESAVICISLLVTPKYIITKPEIQIETIVCHGFCMDGHHVNNQTFFIIKLFKITTIH